MIEIELNDLKDFFSGTNNAHFVSRMLCNTARYVDIFSNIIDQNMPKPSINFSESEMSRYDLIME